MPLEACQRELAIQTCALFFFGERLCCTLSNHDLVYTIPSAD